LQYITVLGLLFVPLSPTGFVGRIFDLAEVERLSFTTEGLTNKQIAERLVISPRTVEGG
jgi:ATP/maltotriose-dependent transcriptional regulator MalT